MSPKTELDSKEKQSKGNETNTFDPEEVDEISRCGYGPWKPSWLQKLNTPRWLLACICWFTFTQGFVVNGIIYVNLGAWERQYDYTSTQVAWIVSAYDVVASVTTLVFGYIGQFMHNGMILGISSFFMGAGSFLMALPQLISAAYAPGQLPAETCDLSGNATDIGCEEAQSTYYWMLIVAQGLHAVGGGAVFTLAIPYMDDNINIKNTPLYIGVMQGFAALGPAMGYICGGLFLQIYVDVLKIDDTDDLELEPSDPRWVGAWWIGLLYSGSAAMTVGLLMLCFPKELPSAKKYRALRRSESYKGLGDAETQREDYGKSFKDIWFTVKTICINPVWLFLTIAGTVESGAIIGFAAFLPKVVQFQFSQTLAEAAVYAGLVVVPGAAGGQVLGGLIPRWLKLRMRGLIIQCLICSVAGIFLGGQFLLRCDTIPIAGVTTSYSVNTSSDQSLDVYNECNEQCNCTTFRYDPICGAFDQVQYFNPCFGGCESTLQENEDSDPIYYNCSCIPTDTATDGYATDGICNAECPIFAAFLVLFFFINIATFVSATAGQAATIRCLTDKQRAFGFGVQRVVVRLLGNVPGPILFGAIFDASCLIWQEDECEGQGACWIYDTDDIAFGIFYLCLGVKSIASICFLLALLLYKPPPDEDAPEEMDVSKDPMSSADDNDSTPEFEAAPSESEPSKPSDEVDKKPFKRQVSFDILDSTDDNIDEDLGTFNTAYSYNTYF